MPGQQVVQALRALYVGAGQRLHQALALARLALKALPARVIHQAHAPPLGREAQVGVVLAQHQAILGAGGHHAVGLVHAARGQIVHQHAHVRLRARGQEGLPAKQRHGGVQPCYEALRGGLLVARGAVYLPGEVQARYRACLQRGAQAGGVYAVVLYRVGQAGELRVLQPGHAVVYLPLHALGHAGAHALHVPFKGVQPLGLQEYGVALLVGKAHHLVLYRGAIARARAAYQPRIARREGDVLAYQLVGAGRGVGEIAQRAVAEPPLGHEGEGRYRLVARLRLHPVKVDGAHVHARGRACLEAPQLEAQLAQRSRQRPGREQALRPGLPGGVAYYDTAFEVYARAQYGRAAGIARAGHGHYRAHASALGVDARAFALPHGQARLMLQRAAHAGLIGALVGLRAQREHGRALGCVEHAGLYEGIVYGAPHLAAQRVYLAHQVPLGRAAYGGVAGHQRNGVQIEREHERFKAQPRAGQRGLDPGMACAHHHYVVFASVKFHISVSSALS